MSKLWIGILFALSAAALNGTIGILSKTLMYSGLNANDVAFYKTLIALILLSLLLIRRPFKQQIKSIQPKTTESKKVILIQIAICAFLGIFTLFFFETAAYQYGHAANVVVILMASSAVFALIFGAILLYERINTWSIAGTALAIMGIFIISWSGNSSVLLMAYAMAAGLGYGLFSVSVKKFQLQGGIYLTRFLLGFGLIYLSIPFSFTFHWVTIDIKTIVGLTSLAVLPTIFGFFCTTKALVYLSAAKVQVTELSEPIFAMLLAWLFLHEQPTIEFIVGAILIIAGIALINELPRILKRLY
ncbi:DMT family transporter [Neisseriaceae bacterium ESL0693]|nr:DMT family transporter [Neisseriaceae bacterium ESL0693]